MQKTQDFEEKLKKVFEDEKIEKYGYNLAQDYILLKQIGITMKNIVYDAKIAAYILDPTSKYEIDIIVREYLEMDNDELLEAQGIQESNKQTSLFENMSDENADNTSKIKAGIYAKEIFEHNGLTVYSGLIVSGDQFVARKDQVDAIKEHFPDALCSEMEAATVAQVCTVFNKPFIIARGLSDIFDKGSSSIQFDQYLKEAAKSSAHMCYDLAQKLI